MSAKYKFVMQCGGTLVLAALLSGCVASGEGIPFPEGYALMPGDRARWEQMDDAQRRRALAYISTGSTIQSAMEAEY